MRGEIHSSFRGEHSSNVRKSVLVILCKLEFLQTFVPFSPEFLAGIAALCSFLTENLPHAHN